MSIALLMFAETLTLRGIFLPEGYINFASIYLSLQQKSSPKRRAGAGAPERAGMLPGKTYFNCSAV